MKTRLGKPDKTQRGFGLIEFRDIYGAPCSIQDSSLATQEALWLGCDHETIHEVTGEKCGARMHLDRKMVKQLIVELNRWLGRGRVM